MCQNTCFYFPGEKVIQREGKAHAGLNGTSLKKQQGFRSATKSLLFLPTYCFDRHNEDSTLLCVLDRIFDEATVFKLQGESFRGKKLDTVSVQTGKVKAVELLADQQEE